MAKFINNNWFKLVCFSAIALTTMSSCIKEDMDDCPPAISKVALQFDYTYNVKQADAFAAEVKNINVYAFDENGKFFDSYIESREKFETGHTMEITGLKDGKYTFVCLARDRQVMSRAEDDEMEFSFASLTPGVSTIDDLTVRMGKDNSEEIKNDKEFAALYTAKTQVDFQRLNQNGNEGTVVTSTLSLMKCTKTYRIVLLPYENDQADFKPENFDVRIEGSAAWLDHNGEKVKNEGITYLPYNMERRANYDGAHTEVNEEPVDQALIYDLSSSRMFERQSDRRAVRDGDKSKYDDKRIIITDLRDKDNPIELFNHSLPWFLALCGEKVNQNWDDQEYLDREDHYVLMFYVSDKRDYNMITKVNVNGWNVNLKDTELGNNQ
ncbi:FimB/Mfa2 family fimbrial subunit [Segatella hominis]|uniref:FimB/Mfa2 family fimbrial subunit n=1 Tax=Segatella hominis TaxID=2518605 RepID=UPI001C47ECC4|nr:FimB/Mfa2 family fimbrial subunit [Segatella hominis]WOZ81231.1 FimB/Mfa2 family fimbrial subunit [Segatella hominis]